VPPQEELTSNVVGLSVYNNDKKDIGTIKDLAFDSTGAKAYILAVGGFLGMGDHYVAVRPSAINLSYNGSDKKWHAEMNANADQLKAAPEYKYPSNS
jgi:sporulation protein YlmC with PRC-barrel domain